MSGTVTSDSQVSNTRLPLTSPNVSSGLNSKSVDPHRTLILKSFLAQSNSCQVTPIPLQTYVSVSKITSEAAHSLRHLSRSFHSLPILGEYIQFLKIDSMVCKWNFEKLLSLPPTRIVFVRPVWTEAHQSTNSSKSYYAFIRIRCLKTFIIGSFILISSFKRNAAGCFFIPYLQCCVFYNTKKFCIFTTL